ncbi:MAG: alanine racemase [Eubacteriales bacterium]|nr:alanine racemase [Eubacteriales bacterium]MDY3332388.1 alanine racemase [Gallibacter sp.]
MGRINYVEVNRENARQNFLNIRKMKKDSKAYVVIKADAYGLGASELAKYLEKDADGFCVARLEEAKELREVGITKQIICLGYTPDELINDFIDFDIDPSIYTIEKARKLNEVSKEKGVIAKIQIVIDTGHSRIGFVHDDEQTPSIIKEIANMTNLEIKGIYSHFSCADEEDETFTLLQIERFNNVIDKLRNDGVDVGLKHIANDAGIIAFSDRFDFEAIRLGIGVYGEYPSEYIKSTNKVELLPVLQWFSKVGNVKTIKAGTGVSYGQKWVATKDTVIATLAVGYADGYFRALSNKASVIINGVKCPIRGAVCMDQMMVDVTGVDDVKIGDKAILIGGDDMIYIDANELANYAGTINYEIMTSISKRVERRYI